MLRTLLTIGAVIATGAVILYRLEKHMTAQNDKLTALAADLNSFYADVTAKLDQLNAQTDDFNPEAQATFDSIKALVAEKHAAVGDADGSDVPAEPTPADGTQV